MFDAATSEGFSVTTLTRGSVARDRVPYPKGGAHTLKLSETERARVKRSLAGLAVAGFVRRALRTAAALPDVPQQAAPPVRYLRARVSFRLSVEERAAIDACLSGRDLTAWMVDAVRVAAGMRNNPWTRCGEALLRRGFRRMDLEVLLRAFPGRTSETLYAQAWRYGLDTSLSDERTTIHGAVKLSGITDRALRKVLDREGVPVATMVGKARDAKQRYRIVRREDVVRAVSADSRRETVEVAAARLFRAPAALRRALLRIGQTRPAKGHHWRLPPEVFDAAAKTMRGKGAKR